MTNRDPRPGARVMRTKWIATLAVAAAAACSDSTGPSRPPDQLNILALAATAPPLLSTSTTFTACKGSSAEGRLFFVDLGGGPGEEFARLTIGSNSLLARPDGTPFADGECVDITMTVDDPTRVLVRLEPSGLRFSGADPARLRLDYGEAEGVSADVEAQIAIWRQEAPGQPFVRLGSAVFKDLKEVEAELQGFTRYALAY